jgi:hypothetical protein
MQIFTVKLILFFFIAWIFSQFKCQCRHVSFKKLKQDGGLLIKLQVETEVKN